MKKRGTFYEKQKKNGSGLPIDDVLKKHLKEYQEKLRQEELRKKEKKKKVK